MKKIILILVLLSSGVSSNASAALASNAVFDFDDGERFCVYGADSANNRGCLYGASNVTSSYFGLDIDQDGVIDDSDKFAITSAGTGLTLGRTQATGEIDQTWTLGDGIGNHYTNQGPELISASGNTASIDMTGWTIHWNGEDLGPLVAKDADVPNSRENLIATIVCNIDCSVGDRFTLSYTALLPVTCPFGCLVDYELYLEGTIASPVPVPSAIWLFGSGIIGLVGLARRKKL